MQNSSPNSRKNDNRKQSRQKRTKTDTAKAVSETFIILLHAGIAAPKQDAVLQDGAMVF